jgi:DNA-binding NarL/FixJ family response regulator
VRVVVAEDLALLRDGLIRLLEAHGFEVVAAVGNGPSLIDALLKQRPDVAVVDVRLPPTHTDEGIRAALRGREEIDGLPVLVLSQYVERLYARELLADGRGGIGYLLKDRVSNVADFVEAVHRVAAGGTVLDPVVISKLLDSRQKSLPLDRLTPREREVLSHMAQGRSNAAIAAAMVITEKAVGKHTNNIFAKLGLQPSDDDNRRVLAVLTYLDGSAT